MSTWLNLMNHHGVAGAGIAFLAFMGTFAIAEVFLCAPVADRFMVTRTGWRLRPGRRWYRKGSIVTRDGEPLLVIDWWRGDGPTFITWVYAMAANLPEDDDPDWDASLGWVVLESLERGPSRREWRRVLRESAAA